MKNFISGFFCLLITLTLSGFQPKPLQEYCNDRFSFCVQHPSAFIGDGESGNGDGQLFLSEDKQAEIRAYGELALEEVNENLSDVYTSATRHLQVSYKVVKPEWFVISGLDEKGKIVYRKTVKKKIRYMGGEKEDTSVYQTLMITYPKSKQSLYGSYCGVISKSL